LDWSAGEKDKPSARRVARKGNRWFAKQNSRGGVYLRVRPETVLVTLTIAQVSFGASAPGYDLSLRRRSGGGTLKVAAKITAPAGKKREPAGPLRSARRGLRCPRLVAEKTLKHPQ
jgi:hypothetical protein